MTYLPRPEGPLPSDLQLSRRAAVGSMFFAGYAAYAAGAEAEPITTPDTGLKIQEVVMPNGEAHGLPAYIARPDTPGRHPVVIVVNEIFGIHAWIKDVCKRWAHEGYVAIAPAFFYRAGDPSQLTDYAQIRPIVATATAAQVNGDLATAIRWLGKQSFAGKGKMGVTGFCWGGTPVWMAAAEQPRIGAGVAFYGRMVPPPPPKPGDPAPSDRGRRYPIDVVSRLHAPVLGLYGGKDQGIPVASVEQMRAALRSAGKTDSEIVVYPDADHGFFADYRPTYNAAAARDAWMRARAWFARHLK
ncbi:MAG: dienelactone hydrolase family protein [Caulobacteraceae bacterium]|nr:dienelactone hydrolase family protein [Caulobacteraceae bacterium]